MQKIRYIEYETENSTIEISKFTNRDLSSKNITCKFIQKGCELSVKNYMETNKRKKKHHIPSTQNLKCFKSNT